MYNKIKYIVSGSLALFGVPVVAFADGSTASSGQTLGGVINVVVDLLNQVLFLLMALAVVMFVWYVIQYFIKPNEDRKDANTYVLYSVIGFFVILSIWGIVNIVSNTFGVGNSSGNSRSWSDFNNIFPQSNRTSSSGAGAIPDSSD